MNIEMHLTPEQVAVLQPLFGMRGSHVIVAAISPAGPGWKLEAHALPADRRDAIRAACAGTLTMPRHRSKSTTPKKAKPI